ncbi:hypothetical protein [Romboutsia ilealis]|uniref:hypothetical protein n=1 Tax=Romboutsia ilealis TaxID=1115758 RepID=UPI002676D944|nr:hypothetical protein [Romboutsia ilealis]
MNAIDIKDINGLSGTYSVKFGKEKKYIKIDDDNITLFGRIKSYAHGGWCHYKIQEIFISKQKTGFGERKFFVCPECGERRTKIYCYENREKFKCRSCLGKNIYSERCNLYDGGGTALIEYKFFNLISELDLSKTSKKRHIPFDSRYYGACKPKHMRYEKFDLILKQLTALSAMRDTVILQKCSYSTQYINGLLNSNSLKKLKIMDISDIIWTHEI